MLRQAALEASLRPGSRSSSPEPVGPTHVEEQRELRNETIAAFHGAGESRNDDNEDGNDDDGGGLLVPRGKTKDELEAEEEEYKAFLEKEVGSDLENLITVEKIDVDEHAPEVDGEETKKKRKKKEKTKGRTKEEEDHEFLMKYVLIT